MPSRVCSFSQYRSLRSDGASPPAVFLSESATRLRPSRVARRARSSSAGSPETVAFSRSPIALDGTPRTASAPDRSRPDRGSTGRSGSRPLPCRAALGLGEAVGLVGDQRRVADEEQAIGLAEEGLIDPPGRVGCDASSFSPLRAGAAAVLFAMPLTTMSAPATRTTMPTATSAVIHEKPPRAAAIACAPGKHHRQRHAAGRVALAASAFLSDSSWKCLTCFFSSSGTSGLRQRRQVREQRLRRGAGRRRRRSRGT